MQANRIEQQTTERATGGALKNIEAVYPLSPMQEGMLFHTLMNPGTGIYLMQNRYYVEGEVDPTVFRQAWTQVIARHAILRTSFVWKNQKRPLQAVHKEIEVPLDVMDWRGKSGRRRSPSSMRCCSRSLPKGSILPRRRSCVCGSSV